VLDDFSPHLKKELRDWTSEHDIELVDLPTYASWLNLIECQFQALRRSSCRRR
jgi:transposase